MRVRERREGRVEGRKEGWEKEREKALIFHTEILMMTYRSSNGI